MKAVTVGLFLLVLVGIILCMGGCATIQEKPVAPPRGGSPFADYFIDRGHDFLDIFRIQWGAPRDGKAFGVTAKLTALAQAGFVYFEGTKAGMERRGIGLIRQDKIEGGITPVYFITVREIGKMGNYFLRTDTDWAKQRDRRIIRNGFFWSDGTKRYWSVGGEVEFLCFGGPDIQIYLCEVGDFLLGIFGLDPRGDDVSKMKAAEEDLDFYND
jgi:hypothetical protein